LLILLLLLLLVFVSIVLLTYRRYFTPFELLEMLILRYNAQPPSVRQRRRVCARERHLPRRSLLIHFRQTIVTAQALSEWFSLTLKPIRNWYGGRITRRLWYSC